MSATASDDPREIVRQGLTSVLGEQLGTAVQICDLHRLTGGSSNESWAFELRRDGGTGPVSLVLRRCFTTGPLEMRLDVEFKLLTVLHRLSLPVPRPWVCVTNDSPLEQPFMIVDRVPGTDVRKLLAQRDGTIPRARLADELVSILTRLHGVDWRRHCKDILPAPTGNVALHEVERWSPDIESIAQTHPLLLVALEWLRTHAPANDRLGLVHGDFKANNLLSGNGRLQAVIDWELAHIGDPYEDLAWTMVWDTKHDIVGGLLSEKDFLDCYAGLSDSPLDSDRLFFWRVFSLVKLAAIFIRGLTTATAGAPVRPVLIQLARAIPYLEQKLATLLLSSIEGAETI